mgnify:CR=1 FL=1
MIGIIEYNGIINELIVNIKWYTFCWFDIIVSVPSAMLNDIVAIVDPNCKYSIMMVSMQVINKWMRINAINEMK